MQDEEQLGVVAARAASSHDQLIQVLERVEAELGHGVLQGLPFQGLLDLFKGVLLGDVRIQDLADVDLQSVKKKFKDKGFARGAKREDIVRGADELGVPLDDHIQNVLTALQEAHERLGV